MAKHTIVCSCCPRRYTGEGDSRFDVTVQAINNADWGLMNKGTHEEVRCPEHKAT